MEHDKYPERDENDRGDSKHKISEKYILPPLGRLPGRCEEHALII